METKPNPSNTDDYISAFPPDIQAIMQKIRIVIKEAAPGGGEIFSYRMPAYKYEGPLIYFAAHKKHIGLYPGVIAIEHFGTQLSGYKTSKGAIQFPLDKEIPYSLIAEIVKFRVKENEERAERRKKSKSNSIRPGKL